MPLTARRRRKTPDEKLPERPEESSAAQVMAPTRMKLRVRRRDNVVAGAAGGSGPLEGGEERSRESGGHSSRRRNSSKASAAPAASSSPPTSSASASARAVMAAAADEASPDSKCPICLDRFNNLAYLDRCLHRFCFPCIQEWSHNKAECPLCKQPFASILHSVRAEDDFKEYTLRPAPANSSVAATVAMVAAMASAARSDHQMRLMLRRHRVADGGETTTRRRRRERGGRGGRRMDERTGVWEWYLDSPRLPLPPPPHHPAASPVVAEDSEEGEDLEEQRMRGGSDLTERGVIFEGLTGLGGAVTPVAPNDRASRRLMTRLAARQRLQQEGGTVRRLRERETVAFRRALYRCSIQVRGIAGVNGNRGQQRDITAESFRRTPAHLNRLRPWLRRELTVLYGAHGSLVDIVQRIIMARLARHGLEDTPTIEEELRPFLLARTEHFLHELVSFARSPLSLDNYDLQSVYEPLASALELDGVSSSSESSSVIAISEGEEEERVAGGRSEERLLGRAGGAQNDVIQTGSCLSLSGWDDETPGPSYSTAEPSCSLASLSFSPAPSEAANEEGGEKRVEEGEEECLIVGYKKPIAERTPELVQLSSDTEEEEQGGEKPAEKLPPLSSPARPLSYLPTIPPSTSGTCRDEQDDGQKEKDGEAGPRRLRARSWSGSSGKSRNSVCTLSPATESERRLERGSRIDRKQPSREATRERRRRRRKRRRRGRESSSEQLRKSGTLYNPNRSIYPAMMCRRSHSPSSFQSSADSGSPLPPSPPDSSWEYHCSQISPLTSSVSSPSRSSSSSPLCFSPHMSSPLPQTPPTPSLSPSDRGNTHHGEKPGGKRKYKSRHLDSNVKDPTWRPSSGQRREKRRKGGEKERRRRGRDSRRRRQRRDAQRESCAGESRRSRDDRSPSVEIIYEGTVTADATQPPAHKRRRKRHRKTQRSSSPVIITLDSDSSHDDVNKCSSSSSSSPLSSQQTVDFSDLPPLPLVHSGGVGGALDAEIGELPVDILDRGSDGSETEVAGRSKAAGLMAIDNSDHAVDVENMEDSGSLLGCHDDKVLSSIRRADTAAPSVDHQRGSVNSQPMGEHDAACVTELVRKRNPDVSTSDGHLLATILDDLMGISAPSGDLSVSPEASCSPDSRRKRFRDPCEVSRAHQNQDGWLAETLEFRDSRTAIPPPTLERRKEGRDVHPLLKQPGPAQSQGRNTPPPLKHKDAGSPRRSPTSPVDLHSLAVCGHRPGLLSSRQVATHIDSHLAAKLTNDKRAIPPISTLKRRFTSNVALRGGPAFTSRPPNVARLDFNSFNSPKLHSSCGGGMETPSPVDLHPVNSSSSTDFHSAPAGWSNEPPPHSTATSDQAVRPDSCQATPVDLHASSSAADGVFSGVTSHDASPPVSVSLVDSRTPSSPADSPSSGQGLSARLSPATSSVPAAARGGRLSPIDLHPGGPRAAADLHSSCAASQGRTDSGASSGVNHDERSPGDRLPPVDLHCLVPPARLNNCVSVAVDGHLNHTALPSSAATFHTSRRKRTPQSEPTVDSHSKLLRRAELKPHNHLAAGGPQFPVDTHSHHTLPLAFQLHTANHITASPSAPGNQGGSKSSPAGERSDGGIWNTNAHPAT